MRGPASLLALCAAALLGATLLAACRPRSQHGDTVPGPDPLARRLRDSARAGGTPGTAPASAPAAARSPRYAAPPLDTLPRRFYYDLTQFDWYRRGAPLKIDGAAYHALGPPVAVRADSLRAGGRYRGVEYYVRRSGGRDTVYVPVYPRYWLRFWHRHRSAGE